MKTLVVNLYGSPCAGKSTMAGALYTELKQMGKSVELVREFATEWAWQGKEIGMYDHIYIAGTQIQRETSLYGAVDYLITDSPIPLAAFYDNLKFKHNLITDMVTKFLTSRQQVVETLDFWLPLKEDRITSKARYHDLKEIRKINVDLEAFLNNLDYPISLMVREIVTAKEVLDLEKKLNENNMLKFA